MKSSQVSLVGHVVGFCGDVPRSRVHAYTSVGNPGGCSRISPKAKACCVKGAIFFD